MLDLDHIFTKYALWTNKIKRTLDKQKAATILSLTQKFEAIYFSYTKKYSTSLNFINTLGATSSRRGGSVGVSTTAGSTSRSGRTGSATGEPTSISIPSGIESEFLKI